MIRFSPVALVGALIATSITIASVSPVQAATRRVAYGDLDLNSPAGQFAMNARIRRAAASVCWSQNPQLQYATVCMQDSIVQAHADLAAATRTGTIQVAAR